MGSKRDAPDPPDYAAQAQAQGDANLDAAIATSVLSNPNMVTPYGTRSVSYDYGVPNYGGFSGGYGYGGPGGVTNSGMFGGGANFSQDGGSHMIGGRSVPSVTITDEFSPEEQAKYDANNAITMALYGTAQEGLGRVDDMMSQDFDTSGFQDYTSVNAPGEAQGFDLSQLPGYFEGRGYDLPNVDSLSLEGLTGFGDASVGGLHSVAEAIRELGGERFGRERSQMESNLAARGFSAGSEAYDAQMRNFNQGENDFNLQALLAAGQEQSRIARDLAAQRGQEFGERRDIYSSQGADYQREFGERDWLHQDRAMKRQNALREMLAAGQFGEGQRLNTFNMGNMAAQTNAATRNRQLQEAAFLRQLPLSEINALRTGGQPSLPQFQAYQGSQVQAAPLFDAALAQGNYDMANYQNQPDIMGGLFGLGGALLGAGGAAGGFGNLFGGG